MNKKFLFQFLIGTVQQQYLCDLRDTLFQNIVYNMPKSRSVYFLLGAEKLVKWGFLKMSQNRHEIDRLFCGSNIPKPCAFFEPSPASYKKDK